MAPPAFTVQSPSRPGNPTSGGHYTQIGPGQFQLIHAIGPGKWAPGPPAPKAAAVAPAATVPANSPLLNPNQTLSGKGLLQAAQGLVTAQTAGPLAELAKQIAANNAQGQAAINQTGGYFNQLGQQAQQGVNQVNSIAGGLNDQLGRIGQDEQSQLQGIGQNATASLSRYAPQSDQSNSLANPALQSLASEIARQQGLAAQNQGAFRSFGANQGANYSGLAASNLGTFGLKGQEALKGIAQASQLKNEPLMAKVAGIQAASGADLTSAIGKLRQQEISNGIARSGLGIKEQANLINQANNIRTNQTSASNNANTNLTSAANNANTNRTSAANNAANNATSTANNIRTNAQRQAALNAKKGIGGARPLSPAQNNAWLGDIGRAVQLIQDGHTHGLSNQQIKDNLVVGTNPAKMKFSPLQVEAALELLGYGSINQSTAQAMHAAGVRGGTFRGAPIKVTQNYNPSNPAQNPPGTAGRVGGAINNAANALGRVFAG